MRHEIDPMTASIVDINLGVMDELIAEQVAATQHGQSLPLTLKAALKQGRVLSRAHRDMVITKLGLQGIEADGTAAVEPLLQDAESFPFSDVVEHLAQITGDPLAARYAELIGDPRLHRRIVSSIRQAGDS